MSLIATGVAKSFGTLKLFTDLNLTVPDGQKVALIGRNGSGKSTLFRILAGLEPADAGSVNITGRISLLEQLLDHRSVRVLDAVKPAALRDAESRLRAAEQRLADAAPESLQNWAAAEEQYRLLDGYEFEARANAVLAGLGVSPGTRTDQLSGGEQRKLMLASLLLAPAEVLLLDEPTNHLDVPAREWLEDWLRETAATVLFVSHDRVFLDRLAERVLELERGVLNDWPGNYSAAMELKATAHAATKRAWEAQERKKSDLQLEAHTLASRARSADRFNHKRASGQPLILAKAKADNVSNTLAGRQKALQKRLERMDRIPRPFEDTLTVDIPLPEVPTGPEEVLWTRDLDVSRDGRLVLAGLNLNVRRGDRIALTGRNGSGKSSLLQALLGLIPHSGEVKLGHNLTVFAAWQHGEELEYHVTLADAILDAQPQLRRQHVYHLLGRLGLPGDPGFSVSDLSGGQRTRLALARLAVTRAHLLILDEPTNNLDLEAIAALEALLDAYSGTIIFASHDRRLVERLATQRWSCTPDGTVSVD